MTLALPAAIPELPVTNIDAATAYYSERLGFTIDWGDPDLGLAGISRGSCRIFLADAEYRKARGNDVPALIWLNLESREAVNELHRIWRSSGARLVSEPESMPWGLHEFTAGDPDGNMIRVFHDFGTPERAKA